VNCLGGKPKRFKFVAYGRLGNLDGWMMETGNDRITSFADSKIYAQANYEVIESISNFFPINDARENIKKVSVAVTGGDLDCCPWERIFYGEFDGGRRKRVLIKIIGE